MVLALLLVAGSLGLNNLAASIAIGMSGVDQAARTRTALAFGLFEAGMPVVGLLVGRQLSHALGAAANTVGGLLLIAVGAQVTISAVRSPHNSHQPVEPQRMAKLLILAAALSIDNLVVGFALGAYRAPLALSVAVIALVSVGLSLVGLELGARLGARVEHRSELLSGLVLIAVGLAILTGRL
jgi:manganese efflux pump family protein